MTTVKGIDTFNNVMFIDVLPLLDHRKAYGSDTVLSHLKTIMGGVDKIVVHVGKKLTISMVERNSSFVRKLAAFFYQIPEHSIKSCHLINTPRTFTTIFKFIKPFLTKNALAVLTIENCTTEERDAMSLSAATIRA